MNRKYGILIVSIILIASISTIVVVQAKRKPREGVDAIKTIRLLDETTHILITSNPSTTITFTITPDNLDNNAILDYHYYFEYKSTQGSGPRINIWSQTDVPGAMVPGQGSWLGTIGFPSPENDMTEYEWAPVGRLHREYIGLLPAPNQDHYTFEIGITGNSLGQVEIRNFNLIITLMDGLPAAN